MTQNDSTLVVGYQPANFENVNQRLHEIDIQSQEWQSARDKVLNEINQVLRILDSEQTAEDLIVKEHDQLPFIKIKTYQVAVIDQLRMMKEVRYAEPNSFTYDESGITPTKNKITSDSWDLAKIVRYFHFKHGTAWFFMKFRKLLVNSFYWF